jgi:hypothetical protein
VKFIFNQCDVGKILLDEPIKINEKFIKRIKILPKKVYGIPNMINTNLWLDNFTGVTNIKNTKGLVINQVINENINGHAQMFPSF